MKRLFYSGITKVWLAVLLLFSSISAVSYGFLALRAPVLYRNTENVYSTKWFSELFSKYVERTAVYVRYLEDGYSLHSTTLDPQLELLLEGETAKTDLENALRNVYEPSETAFYYYYSKLNKEPTNYQYYVKNTETGTVYASKDFERYACEKSGSLDAFLSNGIISENLYLILNTQNNRTMTGGGNNDVLNRSTLLWSMDFLRRPLSDMAEDVYYKYNYQTDISYSNKDSAEMSETDYLHSVSDQTYLDKNDITVNESVKNSPAGTVAPASPPKHSYLLYAFIADDIAEDGFSALSANFNRAKEDYRHCLKYAILFTLTTIFLFFCCHAVSGRQKDGTEIRLHFYDRIFTEFILAALAGLFALPFLLFSFLQPFFTKFIINYPLHSEWIPAILGGFAVFFILAAILYFSLVRRIKAGTFFSSSLLGRFILAPLKWLFSLVFLNLKEFFTSLPTLWKTLLQLCAAALWLLISILFLFDSSFFGVLLLFFGACFCAFLCLRNALDHTRIIHSTEEMAGGNLSARISLKSMLPSNKRLSEDINHICDGLHFAVEEQTKSERMKTELITNVSHDIKTPLTSIINYIELIKNELPDEGTVAEYAEILSQKSWRLKALIDDLVEASKASSGTIKLEPIRFNAVELLRQAVGEFEERLTERNLKICMTLPDTPVNVLADGDCTHRIIENLLSNVCKYALSGTRVFITLDLPEGTGVMLLTIKNTSAAILSKTPEELLMRFSRGDEARSDESSGLGLSIAESLASLQGGTFYVETDGDLFKAKLTIPLAK
ncbi:MAG: HAMP domain-containing histidine kinase [Lachnospiraceae bacterium]|nr:HAMP domain-containing histidine kinase [Lachnospiraceae bacterium]